MKIDRILLDHGNGGKLSNELLKELILPNFENPLTSYNDGVVLDVLSKKIAFSTDSYVVDPIFFPGGSIGDLAINGTVNDLSMCGAKPRFLSLGLVIEEGLPILEFKRLLHDMKKAAEIAKVLVVTGDTKVVPKGVADKIFINTSGIGTIENNLGLSGNCAQIGDLIISTGTIADHGMTIMVQREGFDFQSDIKSDTASLNFLVDKILNASNSVHVLRDPTRGGLATTLNEVAQDSKVGIKIFENNIPIKPEVAGICDLLGFDPMYVANEGKFIAFVSSSEADKILSIIKEDKNGLEASIIGEVVDDHSGLVFMKTSVGGERIVNMLVGEQLPRIC